MHVMYHRAQHNFARVRVWGEPCWRVEIRMCARVGFARVVLCLLIWFLKVLLKLCFFLIVLFKLVCDFFLVYYLILNSFARSPYHSFTPQKTASNVFVSQPARWCWCSSTPDHSGDLVGLCFVSLSQYHFNYPLVRYHPQCVRWRATTTRTAATSTDVRVCIIVLFSVNHSVRLGSTSTGAVKRRGAFVLSEVVWQPQWRADHCLKLTMDVEVIDEEARSTGC